MDAARLMRVQLNREARPPENKLDAHSFFQMTYEDQVIPDRKINRILNDRFVKNGLLNRKVDRATFEISADNMKNHVIPRKPKVT